MMINKKDGQKIKDYLKESKVATIKVEFNAMTTDDNTVNAELWYTSSDDRSLDFIRNIAEDLVPITEYMSFEPKFVTYACPHCDSQFKKANCVSNGKYCAIQNNELLDLDGIEIIMEDLRQHCIYETTTDDSMYK